MRFLCLLMLEWST